MQTYVHQLLADMQAAQNHLPPPIDYAALYPNHPAIAYGLDYIVEWEMGEQYKMDDLFGIKAEQLPPVDRLSDEQVAQLIQGILELWMAFHIRASITNEGIPPRLIYKVLKDSWATKSVSYVSEGTVHVEFCHYEPEECPWGDEFCTCKEFANESLEDSKPMDDNSLLKGAVHHEDGSISWVNPKLLDENGHLDDSRLPF